MLRLVFVAALLCRPWGPSAVAYDDDMEDNNFYEKYNAEDMVPRTFGWTAGSDDSLTRVRRFDNDNKSEIQTLGPDELKEVKGALEKLLTGHDVDTYVSASSDITDDDVTSSKRVITDEPFDDASDASDAFVAFDASNASDADTTKTTLDSGTNSMTDDITDSEVTTLIRDYIMRIRPSRSSSTYRSDYETVPADYYDIGKWNLIRQGVSTTLNNTDNTTTTTPTTTTKLTKRQSPLLDIPALLAIIANLTYDYETNLTMWVNETLQKWNIPTCPTPTTSTTSTTTLTTTYGYDYEGNNTGTIMGKCFVCGLEVEEIPVRAHCADAFAGDFLPLVPVDPTARGQISIYRKYCRYLDVSRYHYNASDPRSLWGRWTGGCSVRWVDLTGVYTQRSCRNRHKAIMGKHFVSKRMAKLEMALQHVDNGCIISPMASLVPFSRGISMYARFHACVCTGNWCNRVIRKQPSAPYMAILLLLLVVVV